MTQKDAEWCGKSLCLKQLICKVNDPQVAN